MRKVRGAFKKFVDWHS